MFYSVMHILFLLVRNNRNTLLYSHLELYIIHYTHIMFIISVSYNLILLSYSNELYLNINLSLLIHAKIMIFLNLLGINLK